jgi:ribokinase
MTAPQIVVIGACNIDLVTYAARMPAWGETLHGERFQMGFGGKGANQAVMAARLGAHVTMIAKLGRDPFGENTLNNFRRHGVDTTHIHFTEQAFTGVAPIIVNRDGQNAILIVTGANDLLTVSEIEAAADAIGRAAVLVCQLEIPLALNLAALRHARAAGVRTIFNPAPAKAELPPEAYQLSDVFCPNEHEAALLAGMPVTTPAQAAAAGQAFLARGARAAVITLGARGSMVVTADGVEHVSAQRVQAIDSTGAGDAFVGSLAYLLGIGLELNDAVRRAGAIATRSVLTPGTQTSFPTRTDVEDLVQPGSQPPASQSQ